MRKDLATLPAVLRGRGYATLAVSANGSAGRLQNLDQGFDVFVDRADLRNDRAEVVTRRALEVARAAPAGKPFLLWVHYLDPHFPYEPPGNDAPKAEGCRALAREWRGRRLLLGHLHHDRDGIASRALQDCLTLYDGEVAFVDTEIGKLHEGLRALGHLDRSLVVFTADHGEQLGEEGMYYEHGPTVHDASLRVPLIVTGAGPAGRVDRGVARLEDVMPTLLSLLGVPRKSWPVMDGVDLSWRLGRWAFLPLGSEPLALAESGSELHAESFQQLRSGHRTGEQCVNGPRFSLCESPGQWPKLHDRTVDRERLHDVSKRNQQEKRTLMRARRIWPLGEARQRTARTSRFKLVEYPRLEGGYRSMLYDILADPQERRDVSRAHPDVVARLQTRLETWGAQIRGSVGTDADPERLESLRALGYIQ